ncbi:MAG: stage II sporulation protein D [Sarcina sp.]
MKKNDFRRLKLILRDISIGLEKVLRGFNINKLKHIITVFVAVAIIFSIPIIFGAMSNNSYQKINGIDKKETKTKSSIIKGNPLNIDTSIVKVYTGSGDVKNIPLEDYVKGVVSTELPFSFEDEAMIAQGILARTFVVSKMITPCSKAKQYGGDICDTVHCQVYEALEKRVDALGYDEEKFKKKVTKAVEKSEGQVLTYDGLLVRYPQYFAISSGKTENGYDVFNTDAPYLKSVISTGEEDLPSFKSNTDMSYDEFANKVNLAYANANLTSSNIKTEVKILGRTDGGSVSKIKLGSVTIKGTEFRSIFGIKSANFELIFGDKVEIKCKGFGHGVGLSQWGANAMAESGSNYKEIIKHYYTGVEISNLKKVRVE